MTTLKELVGKNIKVFTNDPNPTPVTFLVTVVNVGGSNYYFINGVRQLQLELYENNTYTFDQSDSTNNGHPLRFSTTNNGTHGGGSEYTTGVTVSGTPGQAGAKTVIVVASGSPTLYYYCTNHNYMGGIALTPGVSIQLEGQIWYNETLGKFRTVVDFSAWSSGGNLNVTRGSLSGAGTLTAGLVAGGTTPGIAFDNATEEYNGSSWTNGGDLSTGRKISATVGTQTTGVQIGGIKAPANTAAAEVENYNGTSWTNGTALNLGRYALGGAGTSTASVVFGGNNIGGTGTTANVEEWNGSSWSEVNNLPSAILGQGGTGIQTAALSIGGPSSSTATLEYDGTNWTSGGALSVGRSNGGASGIQTAAIFASGSNGGLQAVTERYDGTAWSNSANVSTARQELGSSKDGSNTSMFIAGGEAPSRTNATEEFSLSIFSPIAASWSSEGSLPAPRFNGGQGIGIESAAAIFGGNVSTVSYPYTNTTNEYDGSSWTNGGNLNNTGANRGAFGTQTAGLSLGSYLYPPNVSTTNVEEYNGSAWTAKSAMGTSRYGAGGAGISTAGLVIGGATKPGSTGGITGTEEYNGSGWTAGGAMPNAVKYHASGGTQTAAIRAGGTRSGAPRLDETFEYDGSSWTAGGTMGTARYLCNGSGGPTAQTAMLIAGGQTATATTGVSEVYNGTAWATTASLGTARNQHMNAQFNNANNALVAGGVPPSSGVASSERFTSEVIKLDKKSLTSS